MKKRCTGSADRYNNTLQPKVTVMHEKTKRNIRGIFRHAGTKKPRRRQTREIEGDVSVKREYLLMGGLALDGASHSQGGGRSQSFSRPMGTREGRGFGEQGRVELNGRRLGADLVR